MDTRKFKQVPALSPIGKRNPQIPMPVVVCKGNKEKKHERTFTRPMRTDSRTISAGKPINWDEVYN